MGTSTDAILVYGFEIGSEDEPPEFLEAFDGDFDEYLNDISGLPKYGESGHTFEAQWAWRDSCPADMTMHCSYDYPMYILAVRGTKTTAYRGYPKEIKSLAIDEAKVSAFREWCEANGIEYQEPKWLLVSMWG